MRVKRLQLTNFRGFTSLDLDLDHPLTVLVGANGAGKSSLLQAISEAYSCLIRPGPEGILVEAPFPHDLRLGQKSGRVEACFSCASRDVSGRLDLVQNSRLPITESVDPGYVPATERFLVSFDTTRGLTSSEVREDPPHFTRQGGLPQTQPWEFDDQGVALGWPGFERFVRWFKDREDIENEKRVAGGDLGLQDPLLRAIREAIAELMPGFTKLRIQRSPSPAMVVTKGDALLRLDQLSDGERNLIALTGELARRLAISAIPGDNPREREGVVLIDEIEQHLHPGMQREVLPRLRRAFPHIQFIVTTHSPQVLSTTPRDAIVAVDNFATRRLSRGAEGRDSNAILREIFHVPRRPSQQMAQVDEIRTLIDEGRLDEARQRLDLLAALVTEEDEDVLALHMRLFVADASRELPAAGEADS